MPDDGDVRRDLVVIGASAGGVSTLTRVVAGLPADLAAAVCIVMHIAPSGPSALARILARAGSLTCHQASDRDALRLTEILVAPPDRHLAIEDDHVRLTDGPRENGHRPAVDTLFRSAATERTNRVIGVVLSGNRDDGTAGLAEIKARGGATIVQDPEEALYSRMPASALANVAVDTVVRSEGIAGAIAAMTEHDDPPAPERDDTEQAASGEAALWSAIRALEERAALLERMAERAEARQRRRSARSFRRKAADAVEQAEVVRVAFRQAAMGTLRELAEDEITPRRDPGARG